jgi:hypothetical protein
VAAIVVVLTTALAACGRDAATGPDSSAPAPSLAIVPDAASVGVPGYDSTQFSAAPGDTIRLSGVIRSGTGTSSRATVSWRSTDPAIAAVDGQGLLRAVANGSASIIGTADRFVDTLRVVVSACGPVRPVELAVGQVQAFATGEGLDLCVLPGSATQEFALIPYYATDSASRSVSLAVTASSAATVAAAPVSLMADGAVLFARSAAELATGAARADADAPEVTDVPVHRALRRRGARELDGTRALARATLRAGDGAAFVRRVAPTASGPRANVAPAPTASSSAAELPTPATVLQTLPRTGQLLRLNARVTSACDTVSSAFRVGRVAAITERTIIVADTANPAGGFTDAEYRNFGLTFDTLAYPVDVANFGTPSDVDRNSRVIVFFTRAVNEQTPRNVDYVVGGFFWERDLFPNNVARDKGGCAGSNAAELFYMLVPDPTGSINGHGRSKAYVNEQTVGTLAHEFQHLINASRRLYVTDTDEYESVWLNEGLSHIAEELVFYRAASLAPRARLTSTALRSTSATYDMFTLYGNDNLRRVLTYIRTPESRSPFGEDDELETRGATWQFLRYAADRLIGAGGSEADLWRKLVDSKRIGRPNLQEALGPAIPLDDWFRDWAVSNFADAQATALPNLDPRYTNPSWAYRNIITNYVEQLGRPYPLATRTLINGRPEPVRLNGGSAAYLRFAATAGRQVLVRTRLDAPARQGGVKLSVVRVR